jgi:hypothetical protein
VRVGRRHARERERGVGGLVQRVGRAVVGGGEAGHAAEPHADSEALLLIAPRQRHVVRLELHAGLARAPRADLGLIGASIEGPLHRVSADAEQIAHA